MVLVETWNMRLSSSDGQHPLGCRLDRGAHRVRHVFDEQPQVVRRVGSGDFLAVRDFRKAIGDAVVELAVAVGSGAAPARR